jgi:outer membrane immunogenic protein
MLGAVMKRLAIALLAVTGLSVGSGQIASAADLPVKAPPMVAAPLPWSWTGFYVGGHLGGGWGSKDWSNACDAGDCFDLAPASGKVNGFLGGFQAGYNYQIGWVVVGIEGDFSFADVSGSYTCFADLPPAGSCTSKADWFGTLTGRIGGTVDHALLYVKGGAAWVHDKYTDNCPACGPYENAASFTGDQTKLGWTVGAGVEYAFTRNWSGKVEYDYMDFGTTNVSMISSTNDPYTVDILQRIHVVKAGVNYRFDWGR